MAGTKTTVTLKKEGKHVAHYNDDGEGAIVKDLYMPHAAFEQLGKPQELTLTIDVDGKPPAKRSTAKRSTARKGA